MASIGETITRLRISSPKPPIKQTTSLDIGTQAKLIAAAMRAAKSGYPFNTLLSVRWNDVLSYDDLHPMRAMSEPECIRYVVELVRKWLSRKGIPAYYIWVREVSLVSRRHWHLAFHLPRANRNAFTAFLEGILIEPLAPCPRAQPTRGEFACSDSASWHLAGEEPDGKPHFEGYWLAAYLGKGEPSQRWFRGNLIDNTRKPVRGREFGGYVKGGRYDERQGEVAGTTTRKGRYDIARALK